MIYDDFANPDLIQGTSELKTLKDQLGDSQSRLNQPPDNNIISISDEELNNPYNGMAYDSDGNASPKVAANSGGFGSFMNSYGGAIGGAFSGIAAGLKPKNEFNNEKYQDSVQVKEDARNKSVGTVKDSVASVFGPYAQAFRGVEKAGNALGDSMGGLEGSVTSGLFSGDEAIMAANSDPDISTGDKILGSLFSPYASYTSFNAKKARKRKVDAALFDSHHAAREQDQRMADGEETMAKLNQLRKLQIQYNQ